MAELRWLKILDPSEPWPDSGVSVEIQVSGKSLRLLNYNGKYYAFEPACPHQGGDLRQVQPDANGCIVCPLHRYTFRLEDGNEVQGKGKLFLYPLEKRSTGLYVGLEYRKWSLW